MDISSPFTGAVGHARHLKRHLAAYIVVLVLAVAIPAVTHAEPAPQTIHQSPS